MIEKKYVLVAYKIISGNVDGRIVDVSPKVFENPGCNTTSLTVDGGFIGFIPVAWLVPVEDKLNHNWSYESKGIVDDADGTKATCEMAIADPLVFEIGDILTVGDGDECEHKVLAQPTEDWWCVSGYDRLFNKIDLHDHFTLIRKGPKVHLYPDVGLRIDSARTVPYIELDSASIPLLYNGKSYDAILTERTKK